MRSTNSERLALCRKARDGAQRSMDDSVLSVAVHLAEPSELTQLLGEVKAIRERLDACSLGSALVVTGSAF